MTNMEPSMKIHNGAKITKHCIHSKGAKRVFCAFFCGLASEYLLAARR